MTIAAKLCSGWSLYLSLGVLTLIPCAAWADDAPFTFTTLAGPANAGAGWYDGATGTSARFDNPTGIAIDGATNVYVADSGNNTIRRISRTGAVFTLAGLADNSGTNDGFGGFARFSSPQGIAVDSDGNLYVADKNNHVIRKVTSQGTVTTFAGTPGVAGALNGAGSVALFRSPYAVAVDSSNNVYVADTGNHAIRQIKPSGEVSTYAGVLGVSGTNNGSATAAHFFSPQSLVVDTNGNVVVADTKNNAIRKISPSKVVTTLAGVASISGAGGNDGYTNKARFSSPYGITVAPNGNFYVADDGSNDAIRQVTPAGLVTTIAGIGDGGGYADGNGPDANFNNPCGVGVDRGGNIYVADRDNNLIRKVAPPLGGTQTNWVASTFAGLVGGSGSVDGTDGTARFNEPRGVAVDAGRNVYVADALNHTIRKVSPSGSVSTFAGLSQVAGVSDGSSTNARFLYPRGLAIGPGTNLFVADTDANMIRQISPSGDVTLLAGGGTNGATDGAVSVARFNGPQALAVDANTNVYVSDSGNHTIRKISFDGQVSTVAGQAKVAGSADGGLGTSLFNQPCGIAVDSSGNIFVADSGNQTIRKIDPSGIVSTFAGLAGASGTNDGTGSDARFSRPDGLALDAAGNLYVSDNGTPNSIRKITPLRVVTTLGGGAGEGSSDGTGSQAQFSGPSGVAVDDGGNVYVADTKNNIIRKGNPALSDTPFVDVAVGAVKTLRHFDVTNVTTTSWSWSIVRWPSGSQTTFSSSTNRNPTLTPDLPDLYIFRFEGKDDQGHSSIATLVSVVADDILPTLQVTSPTNGQRWSNLVFTATGKANDNVSVAAVNYQLNGGAWMQAKGNTNWSAALSLVAGPNTFSTYAVDLAGNTSATNTVAFTCAISRPLSVLVRGKGSISPNYDSKSLEIGKSYTMLATPVSGFTFGKWLDGDTVISETNTVTFAMRSNLVLTAYFIDRTVPTIALTTPKSGQSFSNSQITLTGTARDNTQVSNVWFRLNSTSWHQAIGSTNWTATMTLDPNTNTIQYYAADVDGNSSTTGSVSVTYVLVDRLTLASSGQGTFSPNYSNAVLAIDKSFNITAVAGQNYVFSNWVGGVFPHLTNLGNSAALTFTMRSNLYLKANFVLNPFKAISANYTGLFINDNSTEVSHTNSGYVTASVTTKGALSIKLVLAGKTFSSSGAISLMGSYSNSISRGRGIKPLTVLLQFDLVGQGLEGTVSDGTWTAELTANPSVYSLKVPSPQAGQHFTLVIPGGANADATQPAGSGFGSFTVAKDGSLSCKGYLGDGAALSQIAMVSSNGAWPFYSSLYSSRGIILGWLFFTNDTGRIGGDVSWNKAPGTGVKPYLAGFSFPEGIEASGSLYTYTNKVPMMTGTNWQVLFEDGNLLKNITNHVTFLTNKVANLSSNALTMPLTVTSGTFTGTVYDPMTRKKIAFKGAVLQRLGMGAGFFVGTNQTGNVTFWSTE